ncbi:hypothetical protein NDU88_006047 [Pleurodeles waltl]|uniref:Uncharacterized protein n=1 Tax=Pleurodeles waltl TaxID=8319 RepID=A0AAV7MBT0_PLEWA|nr:hypothetical protein NDU88_006047 [Pleurodeles waltl]
MSPPRSVDPRHASAVTQGTRESLSATASLPLQLRPAGSRVQRSCLAPSAAVPKFAHGRSLIHTALSSSRRSGAASTRRGSRARVVASTLSRVPFLPRRTSVPARPRPGGSPVRPQLSRGSQSRPPFCFWGRDGRGSTTGAAFARSSSPEPLRGPGVTRTVKTTSPARRHFPEPDNTILATRVLTGMAATQQALASFYGARCSCRFPDCCRLRGAERISCFRGNTML